MVLVADHLESRMILPSGCCVHSVLQQTQNRSKALFGASSAARKVDDQSSPRESRNSAREPGKWISLRANLARGFG